MNSDLVHKCNCKLVFDLKGDAGSLLVKYDEGNSVCNIFLTTADEALIS